MRPLFPEFYTNSPPIRLAVSMVEQLRTAVSGDAKGFFATENNESNYLQEGNRPKGTPSGPFGEGGGMSPLGRISNGLGGIRTTPQSGCRAARLHPPLVKQPMCQFSSKIPTCTTIAIGPRAKDSLSYCFYMSFYLLLVQRAYFSKEISPCGDCLAIQWGA